jgi:hypothetical protein
VKGAALYAIAIVGGGAIGAVGAGAYSAFSADPVAIEAVPAEDTAAVALEREVAAPARPPIEPPVDRETPSGGASEVDASGDMDAAADSIAEEEAPAAVRTRPTQPAPGTTQVPFAPGPDPDSLARAAANYQRLARIFAAMKPAEAAPVLSHLDDAQLEGILLAMQGRNAAPILAEMDPERAASISRRVLRGNQ